MKKKTGDRRTQFIAYTILISILAVSPVVIEFV